MKEFKVLKILDKFRKGFEMLGVDYDIMRKILQMKFIMDGRRVPTVIGNSKKKQGEEENSFIKSLWVYVIMGLIIALFISIGENYIFQMGSAFAIIMFMIMSSLISDFSSVLLDIRDKNVILSKPVNNITLNMAKIIHIIVYMSFITIALVGPALIAALWKQGIMFFLLFLVEVILIDLFIVALTALLYLIILRFFDGEKLKDIINYVQIGLSITITIGYQLFGRLFNLVDLNVTFEPKWWQYFIIPVWFASPFEVLLHHNINSYYVIFSILALVVPIVSISLYIYLIPTFERNLQKLNNNSVRNKGNKDKFLDFICKIVCSSKDEKVFFKFASKMMKNEREFKLKVYPSLGFAFIFPLIFMLNGLGSGGFDRIASSKAYFSIYFCAFFLPTAILMLSYSANYKGAWIYKVMPIKDVAPVFKGALKAFLVNLLMPIYIFDCIVFIYIFGFRSVPDLIAVILNIYIYTVIVFKVLNIDLPFTKSFKATQESSGWAAFASMLILAALGGIHFLSTRINYGTYVYIVVAILANIVLWRRSFNISWDRI